MDYPNMTQLFSLKNKTAIVTGGTGVLGSAMAKGLADAGANVVILGRRKDAADDLADELNQSGHKAIGLTADVLKQDELISVKDKVIKEFGAIDILVNTAGGNMPGATIPPGKTFFDLDIKEFE